MILDSSDPSRAWWCSCKKQLKGYGFQQRWGSGLDSSDQGAGAVPGRKTGYNFRIIFQALLAIEDGSALAFGRIEKLNW